MRKLLLIAVSVPLLLAGGWYYFHERTLPAYGPLYREYAYITNGKSNNVTVIDLRTYSAVRTLTVGSEPTGVAANPKRNEVYVVNTGSSNVSVIDAEQNKVVATIGVGDHPYFIDVSPDGHRAWVANSGSASVSVIDLDRRAVVATLHVGNGPGLARVSPDGKTVVVSNRADNTVSIIDAARMTVRSAITICIQPEDIAILPDSSKAFVSCSGSGQVASIELGSSNASANPSDKSGANQNRVHASTNEPLTEAPNDKLLALLDVGKSPVSLALKPDGGELAAFNFDAGSISIIETTPNEVSGSYLVGAQPTRGVISLDNSRSISRTSDRITSRFTISIWVRSWRICRSDRIPMDWRFRKIKRYLLVLDSGLVGCGCDSETRTEEKV